MATLDELYPNAPKKEAAPSPVVASSPEELMGVTDPETSLLYGAGAFQEAPEDPINQMYPSGKGMPSLWETTKEAAIGAVQGAARDAPTVYGMMAGLRYGLATTPAIAAVSGPAAPITSVAWPLLTTAAGTAMGYYTGKELDSLFPAVSRADLVPYREGGKTYGSVIASGPAAFYLPTLQGGRVANFITYLGETARKSPKTFLGAEAITGGAMGLAGGASEAYFPGEQGTRLVSELTAGLLAPTKALPADVDVVKNIYSSAVSYGGQRAGRLDAKAANLLIEALDKAGEDPERIIRALRQGIPSSVPTQTAGQKTGSKALMDMEAALAEHHAQFGGEIKSQGELAMKAYQALIDKLIQDGSPQALQTAAQLRQKNFDNMLATRLSKAESDAARKIMRISQDTPAARLQIGDIVKTETELALQNSRSVERDLWQEATNSVLKTVSGELPSLRPSSTVEAFLERASQIGDAVYKSRVPKDLRNIMEAFGITQDSVLAFKKGQTSKGGPTLPVLNDVEAREVINYRSNLLEMAREAAAANKGGDANFYAKLADAMLTDLNQLKNPAFDQARDFSKALNDVFTRTFAREASITGSTLRSGAERVPAEILVRRAFGANADVTAQRMNEITDAVNFMKTRYDDAVKQFGADSPMAQYLKPMADMAEQGVVSVQDAQNRVLRLLANEAVETVYDQATGNYIPKLNTAKLTRFAQQNAPMLEKLGIMDDLRNADRATNLLTQVQKENSMLNNTLRKQTAFAKVLAGGENPVNVIADALRATNRSPTQSVSHLAQLAKASGQDAVDGLRSMMIDYAYTRAGGNSGSFDIDAFDKALFQPLSRSQPSLVKMMTSSGIMTLTEVKNLRRLINPMQRVQTALKNNVPLDDIIKGADAVTDFALRVAGSEIGSAAAGGGNSLVAAGAGSRAVRNIFDKLPNATVRQILENAAKDPEAMAILLAKGTTAKQQIDLYNKTLNYLGSIGVNVGRNAATPALNYLAPEEPRPEQLRPGYNVPYTPQGAAARQLRSLPPAPATRGVPGMSPPPGQKPPGPQSQAPAAAPGAPSQSRAMLQSLFPFDSISAMAAQQPPAG